MSNSGQVEIIGYEPECYCEHCGRSLQHGVKTDRLGTIGADCFNRLIARDRSKFSQGKPGATYVRQLAKLRERASWDAMNRMGYHPHHFVFALA